MLEFLGKDAGNYARFKESYYTAKRKLRFKKNYNLEQIKTKHL